MTSCATPATAAGRSWAGATRHRWFVCASEEPAPPIPADLAVLMRHARQHGCEYVLLDTDAAPLEELPVLHPEFQDAAPES